MYKVHIENKKQVIRADKDIKEGEVISLLIENKYMLPRLTFVGKIISHSDDSNCGFKYTQLNTYHLISTKDIKKGDVLSINIQDGPWYLSNIDV